MRPLGLPSASEFVQDGKRLAPKMLAAEEPIAEFVIHRAAADAFFGKVFGDFRFEFRRGKAVVRAGIDGSAIGDESHAPGQEIVAQFSPLSRPAFVGARRGLG